MNHAFKIRTILFCFFNRAYHLWCSNLKFKKLDSSPILTRQPIPCLLVRYLPCRQLTQLPMTKICEWFNLLAGIPLSLHRDISDRIEAVSRILIRSDPELVRLEGFECCLILPSGYAADQCCGSGSTWIRIDVAVLDADPYWNANPEHGNWDCITRIRIQMDPHWFGSVDPDPALRLKAGSGSAWNQCGSKTLLQIWPFWQKERTINWPFLQTVLQNLSIPYLHGSWRTNNCHSPFLSLCLSFRCVVDGDFAYISSQGVRAESSQRIRTISLLLLLFTLSGSVAEGIVAVPDPEDLVLFTYP